MNGRLRIVALTVSTCAISAVSLAQAPIEVRTSVSKTAVWLGDRVVYTVELRSNADIDVLADDLAAERLQLEGADVIAAESTLDESPNARVRRMRYTLASYRVDVPDIRIPPLQVRYFARRAGNDPSALTHAGQLTIPETLIPIRSTLPDSGPIPRPLAPATPHQAPRFTKFAVLIGIALIVLVIAPLTIASFDIAGRARQFWGKQRVRRARRRQRVSLDELSELHVSDADRVGAFDRLNILIREHLTLTTGVSAHALTPAEIGAELERRRAPVAAEEVQTLLAACETARYAPETPSADLWRESVQRAEEIVRAGRR